MKSNFNLIEEIVKSGVDKGDFPGAQYCLIENGKVECGFYGNNALFPMQTKLNGDEIYDIASLSKIISTTTLTLQLIDRGVLSLDTKVNSILKKYFSDQTTIYDLLTHQSGLNPIVSNSMNIFTKEELIEQIFKERFVYEPNKHISYTDVGYKILGFVLEEVYKKPLNIIAEENIFKPLEMTDSTYRPEYYRSVVTEYRDDKLIKGYVRGFVHDERSYLLKGLSGHAGLFSSARDISKYIYSFLNDEKILSDNIKNLVFDTTIVKEDPKGNELVRSLGYQKFQTRKETHDFLITHTGFTGCNMWIDRKNKRGFVLLSNAVHPKREDNKIFSYREQIMKLFY